MLLNSSHLSYYSRTTSNGTEVEMGSETSGGSVLEIRTSGTSYFRINSGQSYISYSDSDSKAFYIANRTALNVINGWKNGIKVANGTNASSELAASNIYIGSWSSGVTPTYYSTKESALASIGSGLTDGEASTFYNLVQAFQTALSRQV